MAELPEVRKTRDNTFEFLFPIIIVFGIGFGLFVMPLSARRLDRSINTLFRKTNLQEKNNAKASVLRQLGNDYFRVRNTDHYICLRLYTKSLRHSTHNGEEYAMALANRSAVYFAMKDYKSCIKDIDVCLKASYPDNLKPKVLIRKAKCLEKMGNPTEGKQALVDALNITNGLSRSAGEKYRTIITELLSVGLEEIPPAVVIELASSLPTIEENQSFLNASSSVGFRHTGGKELTVFAKKDIKRGDVLFVEKAFAFSPVKACANIAESHDFGNIKILSLPVQHSCQYCLSLLTSCVPCKTCVKHLYCSDECRDLAWAEFHRWECYAIRSKKMYLNDYGVLALRIIFKALSVGFSVSNVDFHDIKEYGSKDNNYTFVYNMYTHFDKLKDCWLKLYATTAAFWVRYLKKKTDFFKCMKQLPRYLNKSDEELMSYIGGLILRHCIQLHTNTIPVKMIDKSELKYVLIAIAVCPSATIMRHSCLPNTSHYFENDVMIVKATEDIKENEEIFRSYTTNVSGAASIELASAHEGSRKMMLRDLCFLNCKCRACTDPRLTMAALNAYLCIRCQGSWACTEETGSRSALLTKEYKCLDCNYKSLLPQELIAKENLVMNYLLIFTQTHGMDDANISQNIGNSIYVPTHPFYGTLYSELNNYYLMKGNIKQFLETTEKLAVLCRKRRTSIVVETALMIYGYTMIAIKSLKEHAMCMKLQVFGDCLEIVTKFLNEVKDVLNFYYPQFLCHLDPNFDSVNELRKVHESRIAKGN